MLKINRFAKKLQVLEKTLSEQKGRFRLFALNQRDDVSGPSGI